MSEAPKKIWVWDYAAHQMVNDNHDSTDVPYIRADLVDGLVELLNKYAQDDAYFGRFVQEKMTRAALKKLEEE